MAGSNTSDIEQVGDDSVAEVRQESSTEAGINTSDVKQTGGDNHAVIDQSFGFLADAFHPSGSNISNVEQTGRVNDEWRWRWLR